MGIELNLKFYNSFDCKALKKLLAAAVAVFWR
jgi:hypothetical protein